MQKHIIKTISYLLVTTTLGCSDLSQQLNTRSGSSHGQTQLSISLNSSEELYLNGAYEFRNLKIQFSSDSMIPRLIEVSSLPASIPFPANTLNLRGALLEFEVKKADVVDAAWNLYTPSLGESFVANAEVGATVTFISENPDSPPLHLTVKEQPPVDVPLNGEHSVQFSYLSLLNGGSPFITTDSQSDISTGIVVGETEPPFRLKLADINPGVTTLYFMCVDAPMDANTHMCGDTHVEDLVLALGPRPSDSPTLEELISILQDDENQGYTRLLSEDVANGDIVIYGAGDHPALADKGGFSVRRPTNYQTLALTDLVADKAVAALAEGNDDTGSVQVTSGIVYHVIDGDTRKTIDKPYSYFRFNFTSAANATGIKIDEIQLRTEGEYLANLKTGRGNTEGFLQKEDGTEIKMGIYKFGSHEHNYGNYVFNQDLAGNDAETQYWYDYNQFSGATFDGNSYFAVNFPETALVLDAFKIKFTDANFCADEFTLEYSEDGLVWYPLIGVIQEACDNTWKEYTIRNPM